jgi:hypothetical protein
MNVDDLLGAQFMEDEEVRFFAFVHGKFADFGQKDGSGESSSGEKDDLDDLESMCLFSVYVFITELNYVIFSRRGEASHFSRCSERKRPGVL